MKTKSLLLGGTVLLAGFASVANAADHDWTGFYVGAQVGYASGTTAAKDDGYPSSDIDFEGTLGGITLGYNHKINNFVVGVEGDYSFGDVSGSGNGGGNWGCGSTDTCTFEVNELGTLRVRVGYNMGSMLPYLTAGIAFGETSGRLSGECPGAEWCGDDTQTGWTAGAGAEFAINTNWSAKAEYLYVDLGSSKFGTGNGGSGFQADFDEIHIGRVGLNYRF